ncbi:hypothetical protein [Halogranum rubrum]|nr:hypothetical protein [Halogranum salarium]
MSKSASNRTSTSRTYQSLADATRWTENFVRDFVSWLTPPYRGRTGTTDWERAWLARREVRWRRGMEVVECFRFADGYVATVEYTDRDVTWQLTAGPVSLAGALFTVALYIQHGVTPQIDPDGRMFTALGDDGPLQVFTETADQPVEYIYVDTFRTLEEFPDCIATGPLEKAFQRLSYSPRRELRSE